MDEKALPHFSSQFQTVSAWREAMHALGYTMPLQLCHGLSQAMTHLKLTFPEAFRLLWDNQKIIVAGPSLIYACSASTLWAEGNWACCAGCHRGHRPAGKCLGPRQFLRRDEDRTQR